MPPTHDLQISCKFVVIQCSQPLISGLMRHCDIMNNTVTQAPEIYTTISIYRQLKIHDFKLCLAQTFDRFFVKSRTVSLEKISHFQIKELSYNFHAYYTFYFQNNVIPQYRNIRTFLEFSGNEKTHSFSLFTSKCWSCQNKTIFPYKFLVLD